MNHTKEIEELRKTISELRSINHNLQVRLENIEIAVLGIGGNISDTSLTMHDRNIRTANVVANLFHVMDINNQVPSAYFRETYDE